MGSGASAQRKAQLKSVLADFYTRAAEDVARSEQREKEANCRTVTLSKTEGEMIGFSIVPKQDYTYMGRAGDDLCTEVLGQVTKVFPGGALSKHNELQPDAAIQEGDVILSVNGVHGDDDAMFAQLMKNSVVLEVERREAQVHTLETLEVNETPG